MLKNKKILRRLKFFMASGIRDYLIVVFIISFVTFLCSPLSNTDSYHVVSYILLFVVSLLATVMEIGAVLLASTLSAIAWNYLFIPPRFTFHIGKTDDILIFGLFFIIALVNGVLTTRLRKQKKLAREREERTGHLFLLTRDLSVSSGINEVIEICVRELEKSFSSDVLFVLQDGKKVLSKRGRLQMEKTLSNDDFIIAEKVFADSVEAGFGTKIFSSHKYTFYPLKGNVISPGVLIIKHNEIFVHEGNTYWNTFLALISNTLEREFLRELAQKARFLDESDRLYKTLFNSISHEIRIPVSTIMGASDSLLNSKYTGKIQVELYREIFIASLRLNRLIENLLNMSRLETGRILPRMDWYEINDLFNEVCGDLTEDLKPFRFRTDIAENMPLVRFDFGLIEQVLHNLILNAIQYTAEGSEINLFSEFTNGNLIIKVQDNGSGFPEDKIANVFDKFFRVGIKTGGLGLGLSIAKGFVEAHKGEIYASNNNTGGACITIVIPTETTDLKIIESQQYEN